MYQLQNVQFFTGREGVGFSATLLKDGQKVGQLLDEGNGGCLFCRMPKEAEMEFKHEARKQYAGLREPEMTYANRLLELWYDSQM